MDCSKAKEDKINNKVGIYGFLNSPILLHRFTYSPYSSYFKNSILTIRALNRLTDYICCIIYNYIFESTFYKNKVKYITSNDAANTSIHLLYELQEEEPLIDCIQETAFHFKIVDERYKNYDFESFSIAYDFLDKPEFKPPFLDDLSNI